MDHIYREIVLKITFIRVWYYFWIWLHWTLFQQRAATFMLCCSTALSHVPNAARWISSLWHQKKKKEQETLRKKSQTLHVWNHGVAQAKFIHDLGLSWILHLSSSALDMVLLSSPDLLEIKHTVCTRKVWRRTWWTASHQEKRLPFKGGACPWGGIELEIAPGQLKGGLWLYVMIGL